MVKRIASLVVLAAISLHSGLASAHQPVCEAYKDAITAERGDSDDVADEDGEALDARDDCESAGFVFRNAPLSDLVGDSDLIVDPWAGK